MFNPGRGRPKKSWNGFDRNVEKDERYKVWRRAVLIRDEYTCVMCGYSKMNGLQIHHIKTWAHFPLLRYEIDNGVTLCFKCHKQVTKREVEFEQQFMLYVEKANKGEGKGAAQSYFKKEEKKSYTSYINSLCWRYGITQENQDEQEDKGEV